MDILVKHNNTNITGDVISYEREHKICTGIGTLTIELDRTINRTFDPWDSIDIHENGDFKVRYYISAIKDSQPDGKIILDCQDLSKKLVDFFIPQSYLIDYPSYTRTWIQFFLEMCDVDYEFQTSSPGNLLSNFTSLGMMTAYEQLLVLLQLSGWYMFFDGNGKAVIGPLDANLASETNSLDTDDILSISVLSDDQMLRNRALVLGAFNLYTMRYAVSDLTVHTRWNYDRNDIRTMVVSNSNIPNDASAYGIGNMLLKEFARITIVKRIEAHGARDFNLGEACRVKANIWKGKGLITTFGVRMSKDGLISDVVLDERCPRLFGFFDFGDYVYVGTYGEGIWRKHIKFDPNWYNFSDGLTELRITDLHINNGHFGSVGASGQMFISTGEDGWHPVTVTGLMSSSETVVSSGITYVGFSGIMARATIVDKYSNNVKFGVDTWSGLNMGDYFLDFSGWMGVTTFSGLLSSGVAASGQHRGWIIEYDPYSRQLVGGLGSGIYPIHYSGNYDIRVIDLENDGINDYVSVKVGGGGGVENNAFGYALGIQSTSHFFNTYDTRGYILEPASNPGEDRWQSGPITVRDPHSLMISDNGVTGERVLVWIDKTDTARRTLFQLDENGEVFTTSITNSISGGGNETLGIYYVNSSVYRIYTYTVFTNRLEIYMLEWNVVSNTDGGWTTIHTYNSYGATSINPASTKIMLEDFAYIITMSYSDHITSGGANVNPVVVELHTSTINLLSGAVSTVKVLDFETEETSPSSGIYEYVRGSSGVFATQKSVLEGFDFNLFQDGNNNAQVLGWFSYGYTTVTNFKEVVITGSPNLLNLTEIYSDPASRYAILGGLGTGGSSSQLTSSIALTARKGTSGQGWAFNGETFLVLAAGDIPFHLNPTNIFPIFGGGAKYVARDSSDDTWYSVDAASMEVDAEVDIPDGYEIQTVFSNPSTFSGSVWWNIQDTNTFTDYFVMGTTSSINVLNGFEAFTSFSDRRATNVGGIWLQAPSNWGAANPIVNYTYIYWGPDELQAAMFLVLQRNELDYAVIRQAGYPIRVDISSSTPVFTVTSGNMSFQSHYIYGNEVETIIPATVVGSGMSVNDYRYTLLEPVPSGTLASGVGIGVEQMGLYVYGSGIYSQNIRTYSGGWQPMFAVPSGHGTRIETSNYGIGGQYIFITASGFMQSFYQQDPGQGFFTLYSGLVQSRATIIRLDDRI